MSSCCDVAVQYMSGFHKCQLQLFISKLCTAFYRYGKLSGHQKLHTTFFKTSHQILWKHFCRFLQYPSVCCTCRLIHSSCGTIPCGLLLNTYSPCFSFICELTASVKMFLPMKKHRFVNCLRQIRKFYHSCSFSVEALWYKDET